MRALMYVKFRQSKLAGAGIGLLLPLTLALCAVAEAADAARDHWAFQAPQETSLPKVTDAQWTQAPIDYFILAKLEQSGLKPSPRADKQTLLRRAYFDLPGLPPSPEAARRFMADPDPNAFARVVDRLLASPHYGERWGRLWLDVARYSDTKGYVYAREERFYVHSHVYRDWVIRAFNRDLPYDRFLLLQLAADQIADADRFDLGAMGFLTVGRRFLGVTHDIIDDRIDVVMRGTQALTVGCSRCHDHKYDPIPTRDYYALYGVFQNCAEELVRLAPDSPAADRSDFEKELDKRVQKLEQTLLAKRAEASDRVRQRVDE